MMPMKTEEDHKVLLLWRAGLECRGPAECGALFMVSVLSPDVLDSPGKKQDTALPFPSMSLETLLMTVDGYGHHTAKLTPPRDSFTNSKPELRFHSFASVLPC